MNIRTRIVGPGADVPREPAAPAARQKLLDLFGGFLAEHPERGIFFIEGTQFARIFLDYRRMGRTSALVLWQRPDESGQRRTSKAVSVLLGGREPEVDLTAMVAVRRLRTRSRYPQQVFDDIEHEKRPVVATLFLDRASFEEDIFVIAAECFAAAFFPVALADPAVGRPATST